MIHMYTLSVQIGASIELYFDMSVLFWHVIQSPRVYAFYIILPHDRIDESAYSKDAIN